MPCDVEFLLRTNILRCGKMGVLAEVAVRLLHEMETKQDVSAPSLPVHSSTNQAFFGLKTEVSEMISRVDVLPRSVITPW
mmetsp:Transcript_13413/g.27570  ORF Transcript_13413/g.27570 Transcript_13413/m.27570 type:complete len:80 (+) Transcript_13413:174-413(+)